MKYYQSFFLYIAITVATIKDDIIINGDNVGMFNPRFLPPTVNVTVMVILPPLDSIIILE